VTPAEYLRGYQTRLGRWMLNPLDMEAFADWLRWLSQNPGPAPVVWGGAA
jgi:hypothetical protein